MLFMSMELDIAARPPTRLEIPALACIRSAKFAYLALSAHALPDLDTPPRKVALQVTMYMTMCLRSEGATFLHHAA